MAPTYLTQEGYDKLIQELEHLRTVKRQEVAQRLHEAIEEGDKLTEDAEYEAAKNEQAFIEGRIRELEAILASARIIEKGERDTIQVGSKVTIQEDGTESEEYFIVGPAEANPREGRISNESPLGKALLDHRVGDDVKVEAPSGSFMVKVLKVE